MVSERPFSFRAQDDEDHRLALCGLSFDARADEELQDFYSRHYDSQLFALAPQTRSRDRGVWEEHLPAGCCMPPGPTPLF